MLLCKKIKIEVSNQDAATLEFMQGKCRGLYNWWVMKLRGGERWKAYDAKKSLQESKQYDPELQYVYGKLLHEVFFRLDKAMEAFFRRLQAGEKIPGFPRFKPRHQFFTLCYPAMYLDKIDGNTIVLLTGGGGKWGQNAIPTSLHVSVNRLAERAVVIGDLSQRQMVIPKKEHETREEQNKRRIRNRMVYNDWGLYSFVQMLEYKCLRFGKELYIISERDTTRMCSVCKHEQNMPLWKRTYGCENENCGLVMDRDENSAVNIYQRFVARLGPHR